MVGGRGGGWLATRENNRVQEKRKLKGKGKRRNWRTKMNLKGGYRTNQDNYIITLGTNKAQAKVLNPILAHPKHMQPPVFCHRKNCACSKSCIYYRFVQYPVISINKRLHKKKLMVLILDGKSEVSAQVLIKSVNLICL